jgi:selenocysteine lyase/cysteine desulfurase
VAERNFEVCRPTLLGAWNVESPDFIAQEEIRFVPTAQRYEPGVLNVPGIYGMKAALELIGRHGRSRVSERILELRDFLQSELTELGWEFISPSVEEPWRGGMVTGRPREAAPEAVFAALEKSGVVASLRASRDGRKWLRFSPHFYNTFEELERVVGEVRASS